uniref:zinc finger protein 543-like n=1 Tax=Styela clava TaxID=7725 RepID=UPI00193AA979|nr:zinc finger protein 543-like [Styela clava]
MSSRCAVGGCYNSARDGVSLHRFPHSIVKCLQWFNFVQKSRTNFELDLVSGAYICSQHFDEKCFVSPDETQNKAAQRKLTEGAIPTIMGTISAQEGVKNRKVIKDHKLIVNRRSSARIVGDNRVKRTKLPILKHRKVIRDDIISDTYSSSEDTVSSHCDKRDQTLSSSENSVSNQGDERNQTHSSSEDSFSNHCDKRDQTFSARADIVCDRHIKNEINDQVHLPKIKEIKEEIPESKDENDSEETAESTGVAKFSCLRCNQDFSSVVEWTQHMTTHTHGHTDTTESEPETKKPKKRTFKPKFKCAVCGKEFQYPSRYEQHIMIHTGEKPYFCKECGKAFTHPSCLTRHMVTHTGEKPFSCEKCKQRFSLQTSLRRHVRTHTGEKPYKCVPCGKSFTQMYSLHRHRLAHNGEKPFGCHLCKKRFTQQCALTSHLRMKH